MTARPERCCLPHPIELTELAEVTLQFRDGAAVPLCQEHFGWWWTVKAREDLRFKPDRLKWIINPQKVTA